ncbi:hypothetical protein FRC10_008116 [Ceratobasidium sp. 414]|nr:hypothetical protein FRC10_008116 [Ceratobasidium sp. 414]
MAGLHTALENLDINADSASPNTGAATLYSHAPHASSTPVNPNDSNIEGSKQKLAALLQRAAQDGLQSSAPLTSEVVPYLPAIFVLAKAGKLDATQLAQLKTFVRAVTENKNRAAQQPGQGSPQVPAITPSFPNNAATMGAPLNTDAA